MDLAVEWRSRRWRRLLNLIEQLPRTSRYFEAITQDERLAADILAAETDTKRDDKAKPFRRMSDWSPEVEMLTTVVARLGELTQTVAGLGGAKPRKLPPLPLPETAADRLREQRRNQRRVETHRMLVSKLLPHKRTS